MFFSHYSAVELEALKRELTEARLELDLMVRSYNQDFVSDENEARELHPALKIKARDLTLLLFMLACCCLHHSLAL